MNLPHQILIFKISVASLLLGVFLSFFGILADPQRFRQAYLFSYLYWIEISLGCLALGMIHVLTNGGWSRSIQKYLEAGMMNLSWMALLILPIFSSLSSIYLWAHPDLNEISLTHSQKQSYLNPTFFIGRSILYFFFWILWSLLLQKSSNNIRTQRVLSATGLILFVFFTSFAMIDWVMSLEPDWYSSIFGLIRNVSECLGAAAFCILMAMLLEGTEGLKALYGNSLQRDLGNILLTFVLLWAYLSFMQFLIVWSGNLPEEVQWYAHRTRGAWGLLALLILLFQFFIPFIFLLFRSVKEKSKFLIFITLCLLFFQWIQTFWMILPSFDTAPARRFWVHLGPALAIGGLWMIRFLMNLRRLSEKLVQPPGSSSPPVQRLRPRLHLIEKEQT